MTEAWIKLGWFKWNRESILGYQGAVLLSQGNLWAVLNFQPSSVLSVVQRVGGFPVSCGLNMCDFCLING